MWSVKYVLDTILAALFWFSEVFEFDRQEDPKKYYYKSQALKWW